ncbi:MAG: Copper-sensing transcriptional repressor CsoR [bacterium ADurb.Bin400]|nr:MAG: Copper-sensing transcriptional repressor CsoR [bacterium ADurb.Bin400]
MRHQRIYNRLRRIEGQIRGIEDMLDKNRPEEEVLIQLEAARSSIASTISSLIEAMLKQEGGNKVTLEEPQIRALLRSVRKS